MFGQNRQQLRQFYFDVWSKMQSNAPLSSLEKNIAQVINEHPEYHQLLNKHDQIDQDFSVDAGETNPFLHMSLHLSIHEQIHTDRPCGIRHIYHNLMQISDNTHQCEHRMMTPLAETIWQAQRDNTPPSEQTYLQALQQLLERSRPHS